MVRFCLFITSLFILSHCDTDVCKMKLSGGERIHLSRVSQQRVDLSTCQQDHHILVFDVCSELSNLECPSTNTDGPGNACDYYDKNISTSFYWVGGLNNMGVTAYTDSHFSITYNGTAQPKDEGWTRTLELCCICNKDVDNLAYCAGVVQGTSTTTYYIRLDSKHCCPKKYYWIAIILGIILTFGFCYCSCSCIGFCSVIGYLIFQKIQEDRRKRYLMGKRGYENVEGSVQNDDGSAGKIKMDFEDIMAPPIFF